MMVEDKCVSVVLGCLEYFIDYVEYINGKQRHLRVYLVTLQHTEVVEDLLQDLAQLLFVVALPF